MAITEVFDRSTSFLEKSFLRDAFLPVALLPVVVAWPYVVQHGRLDVIGSWWAAVSPAGKVVLVLVYFAGVWFLAATLASQFRNMIQLFEGYFFEKTWVGRHNIAWHREQLEAETDKWKLYYFYPEKDELLPTRLGNTLRAAERFSYYRFRADPITLWPRLHHVLPESFLKDIDEARSTLEFLLVTSSFWLIFGLAEFTLLTSTGSPLWLATLCLFIGALGARAAYWSSIPAAQEYGEQLRTGVELHRRKLVEALNLRQPKDLDEEKALWIAYERFLSLGQEEGLVKFSQQPGETLPQEDDPGAPSAPNGR